MDQPPLVGTVGVHDIQTDPAATRWNSGGSHTATLDAEGNAWLPCDNGTLARFDAAWLRLGRIEGAGVICPSFEHDELA